MVKAMEKYHNLPMIKIVPANVVDDTDITIEYSGEIQRALFYGITNLDRESKFHPKDKITRGEAAEVMFNVLECIKTHTALKPE